MAFLKLYVGIKSRMALRKVVGKSALLVLTEGESEKGKRGRPLPKFGGETLIELIENKG